MDTGIPSQRLRSNETLVKWVEQVFYTLTSTVLIQQAANGGASHPIFGLPDYSMHALMDLVQARIEYLQDQGSQKEAPPLHILVVGGSPTAGHGCHQNPFHMVHGPSGNLPYPECAWAKHLENVFIVSLSAALRTNDATVSPQNCFGAKHGSWWIDVYRQRHLGWNMHSGHPITASKLRLGLTSFYVGMLLTMASPMTLKAR